MSEQKSLSASDGRDARTSAQGPRPFVWGVLAVTVLLVWLQGGAEEESSRQAETERIVDWTREIEEEIAKIPCQHLTKQTRAAFLVSQREDRIFWQESAHLAPSEYLNIARSAQGFLACPGPEGDQRVDVEVTDLESLRQEALARVLQRVRANHALLRRAESTNQPGEALRAIRALRVLLLTHPGPLSRSLKDLEREYERRMPRAG